MEFAHWDLWNLVDVAVDGPARRGFVVDITDSQLVVDFGIPNKPPEFVNYENACHDYCDPKTIDPKRFFSQWVYSDDDDENSEDEEDFPNNSKSSKEPNTEVLVRLAADQPCTWYPARVLAGQCASVGSSYLLMDVNVPGGCMRKVFLPEHVMMKGYSTDPDRRVTPTDFVKETVSIPEGIEVNQQFLDAWTKQFPETYPVGVIGNQFVFIETRLYYLHERYLKTEEGNQKVYTILDSNLSEDTTCAIKNEAEDMDIVVRCLSETGENGLTLGHLPPGIHEMILTCLDVKNQNMVCRVCRLWNWIVTTFIHGKMVIVNLDNVAYLPHQYPDSSYRNWCELASSLQKRFALTVRKFPVYLCVSGQECDDSLLLLILFLQATLQDSGMKVNNLVLGNLSLSRSEFNFIPVSHFHSVCSRLVFKELLVPKLFGSYVGFRGLPPCRIPYEDAYIQYAVLISFTHQGLMDVFDEAAKRYCFTDEAGECHVERVADWIRRLGEDSNNPVSSHDDAVGREQVVKILNKWETGTLRFGNEISWAKVVAAHTYANLMGLRKSTLSALICSEKSCWFQRNVLKRFISFDY